MAKICSLGIKRVVTDLSKDKPWFKYKEESNFIQVVPSPKARINSSNLRAVAATTANFLNRSINKGLAVGDVFEATVLYDGRVGVLISPTDRQLRLINAKDEAEKEQLIKEVEQEQAEQEQEKLREAQEAERRRGGYTEEDRGEFYQKPVERVEQVISEKLRTKLLNFLKALNIDVALNADDILNSTNFKNKPLAAFDVLQKFMAFASGQENLLPEQVASVMYTFLGRKSTLSKALWKNIDKWERYGEVYDYYKNSKNKVDSDIFYADDEFVENEKFSSFAHRMAIIKFLEESLLRLDSGEQATEKRENEDIDSNYFKRRGRLNPYQGNFLQRLFNSIYNWFQDTLGKPVFEKYSRKDLVDLGLDIADDIFKEDYKKWMRSFIEKDGELYDSSGNKLELKSYDESINKDPFAKEIIEKLFNNPFIRFKLSGSLTIRKYGIVFRKKEEDIHDIDGVITLDTFKQDPEYDNFRKWVQTEGLYLMNSGRAKIFHRKMKEKLPGLNWYQNLLYSFPNFQLTNSFIGRDHKQGESITIQGYVEHPTEKEMDETTGEERPKRYALDFFLRVDEGNYPEIFDNYWKDWKQIFEAKLNMGRSKDISDLIYFAPFLKDKYKFTNRGFRYFTFMERPVAQAQETTEGVKTQLRGTETSKASPETIALLRDFLKRIGVDVKMLQQIVVGGKKQDVNGVARIMQGLIEVIEGREAEALPEEAMHFAVEIIKQTNPKLYNQLLKEINSYAMYKQVLADYSSDPNYQTKDGKPNIQKLKDEAIGKVLTDTLIYKSEGSIEKPENLSKVQSWWSAILDWLKSLFNKSGFDKAAMSILSGKNIGTLEDIRTSEDNVFMQKTKQDTVYDSIKEISAKIDSRGKEGYYIGDKKVPRRVTDIVKDWYDRRFAEKQLTDSEFQKAVNDLKAEKGTAGHADIDYIIELFVDKDGYLRQTELDDSSYTSQIDPNSRKIYDLLKDNVRQRLNSFKPGTRFMSEIVVYDQARGLAGTIDFLAIDRDGKVSILDWKFMDLNIDRYDDVPWYKVNAWRTQMDQYRLILQNAYGIKPQDFVQTRMIPIRVRYSSGDPTRNVLPQLLDIEIGGVVVKDIKEDYLIPLATKGEKTGIKKIDKLIERLNDVYTKLSEKKAMPSEKLNKAEQLNALFTAIRHLQMRQDVGPLVDQAKILNKQLKELIQSYRENIEGKDPNSFTDDQVTDFTESIALGLDAISTYTQLSGDLKPIFDKDLSEEDKELWNSVRNATEDARDIQSELKEIDEEFTSDVIGKREGVENLSTPEKIIKGLARWFGNTATLQLKSLHVLYRKVNKAFGYAAMDSLNETKKLLEIKERYQAWAASKGLTMKNYFDILRKKDKNELIDEFDPNFYSELKKRIQDKDLKWIRENVDSSEYNIYLKEKLKEEIDRIENKVRIGTDEEIQKQIDREKAQAASLYNISTTESPGWYLYNDIRKFPRRDKWESKEWKELYRKDSSGNYVNKPAVDFYEYIKERNNYYQEIGYIHAKQARTFLPWVRQGMSEKLIFGGKITLGEQFLRNISLDENETGFGQIDPQTGKPIDVIPVYFTRELPAGEESKDLFKTMALYNEFAIKFKYLSDIESQAKALLRLERNKKAIRTSYFGKTQYEEGDIAYTPDNNENADLYENMMKAILYQQKFIESETFDQILLKFGKFGEKINKKLGYKLLPENLEGRQMSINKTLNQLNTTFQINALGLNLLSSFSNFFGGSFQSLINSGKYYTKSELVSTELWILSQKMYGLEDLDAKKAIAALEYFLPLTENYGGEIAKKLALSKINGKNIQDFLMILMRNSEKAVQTTNFFAYLRNTIVENGKLYNAREYLRSTPEYENMYLGSKEQRDVRMEKFERDVQDLIKEKGVTKLGKVVNGEFVIPGVDRKSDTVIELRRIVQQINNDALGSLSPDNRRMINMNVYGNSFMVFKNWIPRLVDVRIGALKYNSASDAYEWGRTRMLFKIISDDLLGMIGNVRNSIVANDKGIEYIRKLYETKKDQYERETGKTLEMTESEFIDLVRQNLKNQMLDMIFYAVLLSLLAGLKAIPPDKDEDPSVKNQYKFLLRATDKLVDEIGYFYDPTSFTKLVSGGLFPSVRLLDNYKSLLVNFLKENYALATGDDETVEKNYVIKYLLKSFPVLSQGQAILPMFYPELAKDLGIKMQSRSGIR
jgi:hypothetical protein